ncbi:MAG: hypothetical protein ACOYL8_00535 [Patescibacteria group bacterium]
MKQKILIMLVLLLTLFSSLPANAATPSIAQKLKGRIILQVESRGEAYYVHPSTAEKYYMANGDEAYNIMRNLGVGITNSDLEKLKNSKTAASKHKGKIFLQVESKGEAYYVDFSGNLHYLKNGSEAYTAMRNLGLGISNKDIEKISSNKQSATSSSAISNNAGGSVAVSEIKTTTADKNTSNLLDCNGKKWQPCQNDKKFYCPSSGDPVCKPSDSEISQSNNYKKDIANIQSKYSEKNEYLLDYIDKVKDLYNSRASYLQGLSDSNSNFLTSSDLEVIKIVYNVGNYYNSSISTLKEKANSLSNLSSEKKSSAIKLKGIADEVQITDFIDAKTYNSVVEAYAKFDEAPTSDPAFFASLVDSFNSYIKLEDSTLVKYWELLQTVSSYERQKVAQDKIQSDYINQINQSNNNLRSYKPIRCYSTLFTGAVSTISVKCY